MSSSSVNIQQVPKTRGFLECLRARPGCKLVQLDTEAVEPTVLTEFSQDPNLLRIYGPGAIPNQDIYLFVAAHIDLFAEEIRKYYDPDNPTKEGRALAKKHCKKIRDVAKQGHLAMQYNAYPKKIHQTLTLKGFTIPYDDVVRFWKQWWDLFQGVARFKERLECEWERRGGWILNGFGRPLAVCEMSKRDLLNRFCQSCGHDILMKIIWHIDALRRERNLPLYPWLLDLHDESIWECEERYAEDATNLFREALRRVNDELGGTVPIKGEPMIVDNLAQVKIED